MITESPIVRKSVEHFSATHLNPSDVSMFCAVYGPARHFSLIGPSQSRYEVVDINSHVRRAEVITSDEIRWSQHFDASRFRRAGGTRT